jgi:hypothetical protein
MSGRTGEARWPSCPQAERLARQRSASLDPFEEDPRSGRIDKPEDSQGTVSKRTKRKHDKLIKMNKKKKKKQYQTQRQCFVSKHSCRGRQSPKKTTKNSYLFIFHFRETYLYSK